MALDPVPHNTKKKKKRMTLRLSVSGLRKGRMESPVAGKGTKEQHVCGENDESSEHTTLRCPQTSR